MIGHLQFLSAVSAGHGQLESFLDQSLRNIPHHFEHLSMCLKLDPVISLLIVVQLD